jgi:DNA-directed RNA polymerase specialized sigma subunit
MIKEISKVFKYKMEEDKEDCQAFAMEDVIRYWNRFDPEKSNNAFAFYTQMIKNGFAKGWRRLYPIKSSQKISISKEYGVYNF